MEQPLKLNYKRTLYIGFAFFSILMLWQIYNHYCPLFLKVLLQDFLGTNTSYSAFIIGIIMAMDNLLAIFMLPLFGALSDRSRSKWGKRMPFIVVGMLLSIVVFPFIVVAFLHESLFGVIATMGLILIIMNIYRAPAVALMPDVTPKPLRSKANGIINLVGYVGAIIAGGVAMFIKADSTLILIPFLIASFSLVVALVVLVVTINERKILLEVKEDLALGEKLSTTSEEIKENKPLSVVDKRNMKILLISIVLWFMAFNAVETFNSTYFNELFGNEKLAGTATIILTISAIAVFIPAGNLALKIGRKRSVVLGLLLLFAGVVAILVITNLVVVISGVVAILLYLSFALAGAGWAFINVHSYPMMVEMAHAGNLGKLTGYYYTASMSAQSLTPILIGAIMTFGMQGSARPLYFYSAILVVAAFLVFIRYHEDKSKIQQIKQGFAAFDIDE